MLVSSAMHAASVRVTGTLVSVAGKPVADATLSVSSGSRSLRAKEPVLNSRFDLSTEVDTDAPSVTLDIDAPGFRSRRLHIDIADGRAAAGEIRLQAIPGLALSRITHYSPPNGAEEIIDVTVRNEDPAARLEIASIALQGTRRLETKCYDLVTPAVTFELTDGSQFGRDRSAKMSLRVSVPDAPDQSLSAKGKVEILPCDQARIDVRVEFLMGLNGGEQQKLRLIVPEVADPTIKTLGLDTWERLQLIVTLSDGRQFRTWQQLTARKEPG